MQRQVHGFNFQKLIRAQYGLLTVENHRDFWDMEINDKKYEIKCVSGTGIELASLLKFYEIQEPFTWIIGWHKNYKVYAVDELDVSYEQLKEIQGNIPIEYVKDKYEKLNIKYWPEGTHTECREWCKNIQKEVKNTFNSKTSWLRKVDSKRQRRWQCSINGTTLNRIFPSLRKTSVYKGFDYSIIPNIKESVEIYQTKFLNEKI